MSAVLYLYRSCSSCRGALAWLQDHDVDVTEREFFKDRLSNAELRGILQSAGMQPSELVSRRSKPYRDQALGDRAMSEDEWVRKMLEEPRLIRRPILVTDDRVVVGFSRKTYESLFAASGNVRG